MKKRPRMVRFIKKELCIPFRFLNCTTDCSNERGVGNLIEIRTVSNYSGSVPRQLTPMTIALTTVSWGRTS